MIQHFTLIVALHCSLFCSEVVEVANHYDLIVTVVVSSLRGKWSMHHIPFKHRNRVEGWGPGHFDLLVTSSQISRIDSIFALRVRFPNEDLAIWASPKLKQLQNAHCQCSKNNLLVIVEVTDQQWDELIIPIKLPIHMPPANRFINSPCLWIRPFSVGKTNQFPTNQGAIWGF